MMKYIFKGSENYCTSVKMAKAITKIFNNLKLTHL